MKVWDENWRFEDFLSQISTSINKYLQNDCFVVGLNGQLRLTMSQYGWLQRALS